MINTQLIPDYDDNNFSDNCFFNNYESINSDACQHCLEQFYVKDLRFVKNEGFLCAVCRKTHKDLQKP